MNSDKILVLNTLNGQTAMVRRVILNNPVLAANYVEVEPGTKPYNRELYSPKTAEEFTDAHPRKTARKRGDQAEATDSDNKEKDNS